MNKLTDAELEDIRAWLDGEPPQTDIDLQVDYRVAVSYAKRLLDTIDVLSRS